MKKELPLPALLMVGPVISAFLLGEGKTLAGELFITFVFFLNWYALGPDWKPPVHPNFEDRDLPELLPGKRRDSYPFELTIWELNLRLVEDRRFRKKMIALALGIVLAGTAAFAWFIEGVILWRAWLLMGLCVLGLLALLLEWLLSRRRERRTAGDQTEYPAPEVNMNYDHEAAADNRVRALQLRLKRLEEWHRSGMIDDKEYEELRNKYLGRKDPDA